MLGGQSKQRGDTKGDSSRDGLWFNPKAYPGHDNYEARGHIRVE